MNMGWRVAILAIALLSGCNARLDDKPSGMPDGYDRVDKAFGVRVAGLAEDGGMQRAPIVEFRSNGDYAMYPLSTDCAGNFLRGQGLVFAPDGTVREQVAAQPMEALAASPQFGAVVARICTRFNAAMAAIQDDASHRKSRFGLLTIDGAVGAQTVTYRGSTVATGSALRFDALQALGGADAVLVHEGGSADTCPGGEYFVVGVDASGAHESTHFGNCVEGAAKLGVEGQRLTIVLPEGAQYAYENGEVTGGPAEAADDANDAAAIGEDGDAMGADAGAAAAEAAATAADAAAAAADVPVADAPRVAANDLSGHWMAQCRGRSRQVSTPAGSLIGLNESESRQYCGCIWNRAGEAAASLVRRGGLKDAPSALLPSAHAACLQELM